MPPMTKAALQAALDMNEQIVALSDALHTERARTAAAEAQVAMLRNWIIEADAAFNVDNKPAETLDDCLGLVRMCHEGAQALAEVESLRAELAKAIDLFHGTHELCDEAGSEEWVWRFRALYLLDGTKPLEMTGVPGDCPICGKPFESSCPTKWGGMEFHHAGDPENIVCQQSSGSRRAQFPTIGDPTP